MRPAIRSRWRSGRPRPSRTLGSPPGSSRCARAACLRSTHCCSGSDLCGRRRHRRLRILPDIWGPTPNHHPDPNRSAFGPSLVGLAALMAPANRYLLASVRTCRRVTGIEGSKTWTDTVNNYGAGVMTVAQDEHTERRQGYTADLREQARSRCLPASVTERSRRATDRPTECVCTGCCGQGDSWSLLPRRGRGTCGCPRVQPGGDR